MQALKEQFPKTFRTIDNKPKEKENHYVKDLRQPGESLHKHGNWVKDMLRLCFNDKKQRAQK